MPIRSAGQDSHAAVRRTAYLAALMRFGAPSRLTSPAGRLILSGSRDKTAIWNVNTEQAYHEAGEKKEG